MSPQLKDWVEVLANLATAIGFIAVVITLLLTWRNYLQQNKQNNLDFQFKLWNLLTSKPAGQKDICELIDAQEWDKLKEIPPTDRRQKLFLFEQIALLVKAKYMHPNLAHYMFGYHAIRCWERPEFWSDLPDKTSGYWKVLQEFVERMRQVEAQPWKERGLRF